MDGASTSTTGSQKALSPGVLQLMEMGIELPQARGALRRFNQDVAKAADFLFSGGYLTPSELSDHYPSHPASPPPYSQAAATTTTNHNHNSSGNGVHWGSITTIPSSASSPSFRPTNSPRLDPASVTSQLPPPPSYSSVAATSPLPLASHPKMTGTSTTWDAATTPPNNEPFVGPLLSGASAHSTTTTTAAAPALQSLQDFPRLGVPSTTSAGNTKYAPIVISPSGTPPINSYDFSGEFPSTDVDNDMMDEDTQLHRAIQASLAESRPNPEGPHHDQLYDRLLPFSSDVTGRSPSPRPNSYLSPIPESQEEQDLARAIQASMASAMVPAVPQDPYSPIGWVDPPNPLERRRKSDDPVGLRPLPHTIPNPSHGRSSNDHPVPLLNELCLAYFHLAPVRDHLWKCLPTGGQAIWPPPDGYWRGQGELSDEKTDRSPGGSGNQESGASTAKSETPAPLDLLGDTPAEAENHAFVRELTRLFAFLTLSKRSYVDSSLVGRTLEPSELPPPTRGELKAGGPTNQCGLSEVEAFLSQLNIALETGRLGQPDDATAPWPRLSSLIEEARTAPPAASTVDDLLIDPLASGPELAARPASKLHPLLLFDLPHPRDAPAGSSLGLLVELHALIQQTINTQPGRSVTIRQLTDVAYIRLGHHQHQVHPSSQAADTSSYSGRRPTPSLSLSTRIYMDRYLTCNADVVQQIEARVKSRKARLDRLHAAQAQHPTHHQGVPIPNLLQDTERLLERLQGSPTASTSTLNSADGVAHSDDFTPAPAASTLVEDEGGPIPLDPKLRERLSPTGAFLAKLANIRQQTQEMCLSEAEQLAHQMDGVYEDPRLRRFPYDLHAVILKGRNGGNPNQTCLYVRQWANNNDNDRDPPSQTDADPDSNQENGAEIRPETPPTGTAEPMECEDDDTIPWLRFEAARCEAVTINDLFVEDTAHICGLIYLSPRMIRAARRAQTEASPPSAEATLIPEPLVEQVRSDNSQLTREIRQWMKQSEEEQAEKAFEMNPFRNTGPMGYHELVRAATPTLASSPPPLAPPAGVDHLSPYANRSLIRRDSTMLAADVRLAQINTLINESIALDNSSPRIVRRLDIFLYRAGATDDVIRFWESRDVPSADPTSAELEGIWKLPCFQKYQTCYRGYLKVVRLLVRALTSAAEGAFAEASGEFKQALDANDRWVAEFAHLNAPEKPSFHLSPQSATTSGSGSVSPSQSQSRSPPLPPRKPVGGCDPTSHHYYLGQLTKRREILDNLHYVLGRLNSSAIKQVAQPSFRQRGLVCGIKTARLVSETLAPECRQCPEEGSPRLHPDDDSAELCAGWVAELQHEWLVVSERAHAASWSTGQTALLNRIVCTFLSSREEKATTTTGKTDDMDTDDVAVEGHGRRQGEAAAATGVVGERRGAEGGDNNDDPPTLWQTYATLQQQVEDASFAFLSSGPNNLAMEA
ncbi:hypothetical protein BJ085DRAFT_35019 [Dimargaris cristalligena]|uniref:UBA domain-containing protein n=1 Tax=Dimargaris cristalligena TaxID=215637 RepID=A0A4Q0A1P4_9FUNG|nr:hypothetical protein BJ085DRAFT_35019 [Dimargaris cristalligena]|eukprot:RKP39381.1 hypothetical protein BJ085DRAFT_35019 [Dimargaris cristalligena]